MSGILLQAVSATSIAGDYQGKVVTIADGDTLPLLTAALVRDGDAWVYRKRSQDAERLGLEAEAREKGGRIMGRLQSYSAVGVAKGTANFAKV